jgi:hypothetical protein
MYFELPGASCRVLSEFSRNNAGRSPRFEIDDIDRGGMARLVFEVPESDSSEERWP